MYEYRRVRLDPHTVSDLRVVIAMISIGDFARLGRLSVRMLRHYDQIGLLRPARVDPSTGYRYYEASQLSRLNRILALKDLGFTLQQVQSIVDDEPSLDSLKEMLEIRRNELEEQLADDMARLARVEARLSLIEREGLMPTNEVVVKRVPAIFVAEMKHHVSSYEPKAIAPVLGPLFERLCHIVFGAGIQPAGPLIAYYEPMDEGVLVHAAAPISPDTDITSTDLGEDIAFVELPEIEAATLVHQGSLDNADAVVQELARWIDSHGYVGSGYAREVYLENRGPRDEWVTEFQEPVVKVSASHP